VNVVDNAIVTVGCLGGENVGVLATVSVACRPRNLPYAMVPGLLRDNLTFDVERLLIHPVRL